MIHINRVINRLTHDSETFDIQITRVRSGRQFVLFADDEAHAEAITEAVKELFRVENDNVIIGDDIIRNA